MSLVSNPRWPSEFMLSNHEIYVNIAEWKPTISMKQILFEINRAVLTELICYISGNYKHPDCHRDCGPNQLSIKMYKQYAYWE